MLKLLCKINLCHLQLDMQLLGEKNPYKCLEKQMISWEIVGYNVFVWVLQSNTSMMSTLEEFMRKILILIVCSVWILEVNRAWDHPSYSEDRKNSCMIFSFSQEICILHNYEYNFLLKIAVT